MSNNLFSAMSNFNNPYAQMIGEIMNFAKTLNGNPQQMVQNLLNTGAMSQTEFNRFTKIAQQIVPFMGK